MKRRRIFIAINLPKEAKKELLFHQRKWADLPVRWTKAENLHLTLIFLGYIADADLLNVFEAARKRTVGHRSFALNFKKICLGPPDKFPRMFWVEGEENQDLSALKNDLEEELTGVKFQRESRAFRPHITLGRIKIDEWRKLQSRPKIEENISLAVPVNSIEIMESQLKPGGPDYFVLESVNLGEK